VSVWPLESCPVTVTTFTCEVPPGPEIVFWKVQLTCSPGLRLIGTSKQPFPPSSSRSPNLSSTTLSIVTFTSADVFVMVTENVTGPPGSLRTVGSADFETLIEPWPRGTSLFVTVQTAVPPSGSRMFEQPWYVVV